MLLFLKRRFLPHKICEIRPHMLNLVRYTGPTHSLKKKDIGSNKSGNRECYFISSRAINTSARE